MEQPTFGILVIAGIMGTWIGFLLSRRSKNRQVRRNRVIKRKSDTKNQKTTN